MEAVKAGGYVSKVHFNDGTYVDIQQNDIIIFVGPNNTGKSQSLKDIYALSSKKNPNYSCVRYCYNKIYYSNQRFA